MKTAPTVVKLEYNTLFTYMSEKGVSYRNPMKHFKIMSLCSYKYLNIVRKRIVSIIKIADYLMN